MRGGRRPGAGRKAGSLTKKTREIAVQAAHDGITPLEVMIKTMRGAWEAGDTALACSVAKDAAPYIHPKLISSETKNETTVSYVAQMPPVARDSDEWALLHSPTIQ